MHNIYDVRTDIGSVLHDLTQEVYTLRMKNFKNDVSFINRYFKWNTVVSNFSRRCQGAVSKNPVTATLVWISAADLYFGEKVQRELHSIHSSIAQKAPAPTTTYASLSGRENVTDANQSKRKDPEWMRDSLAKVNDAVKGFISDEICTAEAFTRALRIALHWLKCDKVAKKIQVIFDGSHWKSTNGNDVSDVNKTDVLDSPVWLYYFLLLLLGAQHQCSIHLSHECGPVASLLSMDDLKAVMGLLSDVVEKTFRLSLSSLKWMYVKSTICTKLPRSRIDDLLQHRRVDGLLDLLVKDIPREIRLRTELLSDGDQKDNTNVVNEVRTIVVTETLLQKSDNSSAYTFGEAGNVKAGESVLFQILVGILEPELRKLLLLTSKECLEATAPTAAVAGKEEENPADEGTEVIEKNMNQEQKQSLSLLHTVAKALEELEVGGDVPQALFEACNFCKMSRSVPLTNVGYICFTAAVDAALQTILSDLLEWCLEDPSVKSEFSQLSKSLFGQLMAREPFYYLLTSASIPILKESKPKLCSRVQQQLISDYPSVSTYFIYPALNAIHKYLVDAETTGKEGARPKRGGAKDGPPAGV
ncbi:hypothetical protein AGDE_16943 [Angomonas deanei]|nr:hypothetical protein AGDE_16943 [Angomonas deanei]|eukprot:EPY15843.1 hypothetical protein AGDE_16943 [Angomonas deanei]